MKKTIIISLFVVTALLSDNFLGTPILAPTLKPHHEIKSYSKNIDNPPPKVEDRHSKKYTFKKDNHRYDKRYKHFLTYAQKKLNRKTNPIK